MFFPNIKILLIQKHMNQGDLSKKTGISRTSLSLKLNGKRDFTKPEIDKLIEFFQNTYEYIFFEEKIPNM